jgi:hypothetical protein
MTTVRSWRASSRLALPAIAALLVCSAQLSAHRLDEYLQAARIGVGADSLHLEMSLTPGIAVADRVIREIDRDGDGVIAEAEQRAYAERVLSAITVRVDEAPALRLRPAGSSVPDPTTIRSGNGVISIRSEAPFSRLSAGPHRVHFRNNFVDDPSVYLANALVPDDERVAVTGQERRVDQSELTIAFSVRETAAPAGGYIWIGLAGAMLVAGAWMIHRRRAVQESHWTGEKEVRSIEFS